MKKNNVFGTFFVSLFLGIHVFIQEKSFWALSAVFEPKNVFLPRELAFIVSDFG